MIEHGGSGVGGSDDKAGHVRCYREAALDGGRKVADEGTAGSLTEVVVAAVAAAAAAVAAAGIKRWMRA
jgi:hypothetical protein